MISVIIEDEAVWFSFLTFNCVLAFVSAAVQPVRAGLYLVCLHRPLRPTPGAVCAQKELRSQFYSQGWILNRMERLENGKKWGLWGFCLWLLSSLGFWGPRDKL